LPNACALAGVAHHDVEAPLADAQAHRRQPEPLDLEVAHHVGDAAALAAEQVACFGTRISRRG
jgi:hypothetical protein